MSRLMTGAQNLKIKLGFAIMLRMQRCCNSQYKNRNSLLFVLNLEESGNLVEGFVFSFGNFFVGEDPEDCQEHTKGKEGVVLQHRL